MKLKKADKTLCLYRSDQASRTAVYLGDLSRLIDVTDMVKWECNLSERGSLLEYATLEKIAKQFEGCCCLITVMHEMAKGGEIYQYNNYCDGEWYEMGTVAGYA